MKTVAELNQTSVEITSEITFLKKELEFLLQMLRNGYSVSIDRQKTKLLDSYWKGFEESINNLNALLGKLNSKEKTIRQENELPEEEIVSTFSHINNKVKVLKQSFYEYMAGCCVCFATKECQR